VGELGVRAYKMTVSVKSIESSVSFAEGTEVIRVSYDLGTLEIYVRGISGQRAARVTFQLADAFRVMDEGDLSEFWPVCPPSNGWIFEVTDGGWLSQERNRSGALLSTGMPALREFLICGCDDCVNIISREFPKINESQL
jgi:hypothetical protein